MVSFNLIEGNDDWISVYPEFKKDFLDVNVHVPELKQKYDLTHGKYNYLRKRVLDETGLEEKPVKLGGRNLAFKEGRFIVQDKKGTCRIYKTINRVKTSFGSYPDFETAKIVRDKLMECNWDMKIADELKEKYSTTAIKKKERIGKG